jgi:hypothetical protein
MKAICRLKHEALGEMFQKFGLGAAKQAKECFALFWTKVRFVFLTQKNSSNKKMRSLTREIRWRVSFSCELNFNNQTFFKEELLEILPGTDVSTWKAC